MSPPDFSPYPQPESNDTGSVEAALDALRGAHNELSAVDACDALLWAMGNNHAGTYFPIVLGVLPAIEQVLEAGSAWAQRAAMEALLDLCGTFIPAPGYEQYQGASVPQALDAFLLSLRHHVAPLAHGSDLRAQSAADLLELMDDKAATAGLSPDSDHGSKIHTSPLH